MNEGDGNLLQQLGRTGRIMYAAFEAEVGHPLTRWRILQALHEGKQATQKQLAQQLMIDPGALTRHMKAMEAEGLITRQSTPEDNRLTAVALTDAGTGLIEATQTLRAAFAKKVLHDLPPDQLETTMAILRCLEERFRRMQG
ncbi:MAG: MarR family winged helix-turn-helix transcriptional regulator [Thiobacillaceae bacterium]